jgi:hypothetical protein
MRPAMSVVCLALVALACDNQPVAPKVVSPLVGDWVAPTENLHPKGTMTRRLGISESGEFTFRTDMFGIYPGQNPSYLSAYTRMTGTFTIDGDKLVLTATRVATWDSFYGAGSQERVETVNTVLLDQAHFGIVGQTLTLNYVSYPADAPVPTTMSFTRLGLD